MTLLDLEKNPYSISRELRRSASKKYPTFEIQKSKGSYKNTS